MATATIASVWTSEDGALVWMAAAVNEGARGTVEYIASVKNDSSFQALTNAGKKAALITAVKAVRDPQVSARTAIPGISGSGTV